VVKNGACRGNNENDRPESRPDSFDEEGVATADTMKRFKDEKFKLVAKRKFLSTAQVTDEYSIADGDEEKDNGKDKERDKNKKKIRMTRLSDDLFEYVAEVDEDEIEQQPDTVPESGTEPLPEVPEEVGGDRKLWVYDPDTRVEMNTQGMATYWPQRLNGRTGIGCSGTIISSDAVLTAGHCVYEYGNWLAMDFTPAQYRTIYDQLQTPFGKYNWRYVTTYTAWARDRNFNYDMAVVRYWPNNGLNIGDRLGYAGLRRTYSDSVYLDNTYNTGYPTDKGNQEMWKSYCGAAFLHSSNVYTVKHFCDMTYGNSGGSFMDYYGYVHAIVSGHYEDKSANVAVLLSGIHYDNALSWAGR
jgi:V8-like Glu-specific endopeptidase